MPSAGPPRTGRPLDGRTVVVTRARGQAGSLVDRLEALGAHVAELPVIAIAEAADGGAALRVAARRASSGGYQWVAVTSANAATRWVDALGDDRTPPGVRVAAVGTATERVLAAAGLEVDLVPGTATAAALAAAFPDPPAGGGTVLFPRAEAVEGSLADGLRARGWSVDEVVAYRTVAGEPDPDQVAAATGADAVAFTSSSTVERTVDLLGAGGVPAVVVTIGPGTSAAALTSGLTVAAEAEEHTVDGLVGALVAVLGGPGPSGRRAPGRALWITMAVVLGLQLVGLLTYSAFLFHRFDLTDDFGTYAQAWWLIGHGHLNPVDTIQTPSYPFWQSHFELAMWPIALVGRVWPNAVQLLWLQDLAIVGTEWAAMAWVAAVCAAHRRGPVIPICALAFLVVNPWWYQAASFDMHFELLGLPFTVWSAYALWRGRTRTCLVTAVVAVLFGDVVTVTVLCVALAGLLSRRVRRRGGLRTCLGVGAVAVAWLALITLLGANRGSGLVDNYGYLVGAGTNASSTTVVGRLVLHPGHALRVLFDRRAGIGRVLASAGLLGVATPWGLTVALGTLGPAALNSNTAFLTPTIAFQTLAVIPFVFVGTVMVLLRIGTGPAADTGSAPDPHRHTRRRTPRPVAWVAVALALAVAALGLVQGVPVDRSVRADWWRVDAPTAAALRTVLPRVPTGAEVIVSQGVLAGSPSGPTSTRCWRRRRPFRCAPPRWCWWWCRPRGWSRFRRPTPRRR